MGKTALTTHEPVSRPIRSQAACCLSLRQASGSFLDLENVVGTIVPVFTHIAIMAIGVTFAILTGGIDASWHEFVIGSAIIVAGLINILRNRLRVGRVLITEDQVGGLEC